jgi:hypothetical protein
MKGKLLKSFIRSNYKSTIIALPFVLLLVYFDHSLYIPFFFLLSIARDYYHYEAKQSYINRLKAKGLTPDDIYNINFVKQWDEIRKKGLWLYCITDGGIILGAYLWLGVSILLIATSIVKFQNLVNEPGNMFAFIGYTYLTGAVIGIIINRIRWPYNEGRFMKLTDPLSEGFQQMLLDEQ